MGISKNRMLAFFKNSHLRFFLLYELAGTHWVLCEFFNKKKATVVTLCQVLGGRGGLYRIQTRSQSRPLGWIFIWPPTKRQKSGWRHALGPMWRWLLSTPSSVIPCTLDSGLPVTARMWKVQQTEESVARIPEFIDLLLFCYFNTREFVSFKGAVLLLPACFIHVCRGGRGVGPLVAACWPSLQPWLGHQAFHPSIYILRLPACSYPSLNFLLSSLLPLISFKKPLLCTIISLLFFVTISSSFRVRHAGSECSASSFFFFPPYSSIESRALAVISQIVILDLMSAL
jgi:hypothetical protein